MTGPSWSAVEKEAALPAAATLEELDQIVANDKRIEQRILEREQRLYERYNKLNANNDFDVDCSVMWSNRNLTSYGVAHFKRLRLSSSTTKKAAWKRPFCGLPVSNQPRQISLVAGAGFEPATFGL
jgi:hypothetical protein